MSERDDKIQRLIKRIQATMRAGDEDRPILIFPCDVCRERESEFFSQPMPGGWMMNLCKEDLDEWDRLQMGEWVDAPCPECGAKIEVLMHAAAYEKGDECQTMIKHECGCEYTEKECDLIAAYAALKIRERNQKDSDQDQ